MLYNIHISLLDDILDDVIKNVTRTESRFIIRLVIGIILILGYKKIIFVIPWSHDFMIYWSWPSFGWQTLRRCATPCHLKRGWSYDFMVNIVATIDIVGSGWLFLPFLGCCGPSFAIICRCYCLLLQTQLSLCIAWAMLCPHPDSLPALLCAMQLSMVNCHFICFHRPHRFVAILALVVSMSSWYDTRYWYKVPTRLILLLSSTYRLHFCTTLYWVPLVCTGAK